MTIWKLCGFSSCLDNYLIKYSEPVNCKGKIIAQTKLEHHKITRTSVDGLGDTVSLLGCLTLWDKWSEFVSAHFLCSRRYPLKHHALTSLLRLLDKISHQGIWYVPCVKDYNFTTRSSKVSSGVIWGRRFTHVPLSTPHLLLRFPLISSHSSSIIETLSLFSFPFYLSPPPPL